MASLKSAFATQRLGPLGIETEDGAEAFQVIHVDWTHRFSQPFECRVELLSVVDDWDLTKLLKTPVGIRIDRKGGEALWLHGYIQRLENLGPERRRTRYRAMIVPFFSLLKHSGGCRIFQEFTTIEIVKKVLSTFDFASNLEDRVTSTYSKRDYCVQYCESDFNFLSRILEEEGIYYFFESDKDKHTMVLADDIQAHKDADGAERISYRNSSASKVDEYLTGYSAKREFGTAGVELSDYDFEKPRAQLRSKQLAESGDARWLWKHYPGNFTETERGAQLAKIRQQAIDAASVSVSLIGNVRSLRCGNKFKLQDHPTSDFNIDYLVTAHRLQAGTNTQQTGDQKSFKLEMAIDCQPTKLAFRPKMTAEKGTIRGPHVAVVCGKEGEEIWTDQYGRIKVQFPWDQEGKNDEHSSCWVRVAQAWTGKNWGAMSLPRIGDEVIVEFLDGDPDRPIVTGRVYNADRMPPEALADAQAKTIFRTRSTKGGDSTTFHELTFDDTKDAEQIYLHSERDFLKVVENNDVTQIGFIKKDPGDHSLAVYHDSKIEIGKESGNGSLTVDIQQDRTVTIAGGSDALTVQKGDIVVKVSAGSASIEAAKSIELKCGQSSIQITPSGITLSATNVKLQAKSALDMQGANSTLAASGNLELKGTMSKLTSSGPLTVKGAIVQIN